MAGAAWLFAWLGRDGLRSSGFLLWRESRAAPPRLQRQYRRWFPRRATDAGIYRGKRYALAEQASRLYARPRPAPNIGYADGIDRHQRRRLLLGCSYGIPAGPGNLR